MKVINLFGAPSAGKSTTMLGLTYKMKLLGLSAENTPEFYKELILEESSNAKFGGQLYILGEQNKRLARLLDKNDFAVTDCPLPLIGYYSPEGYVKGFHDFSNSLYNIYDNVNYFLVRKHEFENEKRKHSEEESNVITVELPLYLKKYGINFTVIETDPNKDTVDTILDDMVEQNIITHSHLSKSRNKKVRSSLKIK